MPGLERLRFRAEKDRRDSGSGEAEGIKFPVSLPLSPYPIYLCKIRGWVRFFDVAARVERK
jgi:hypothetical protein